METKKKAIEPRTQLRHGLLVGKAHFAEAIQNRKIERRGNRLFETNEIALITTAELAEFLDCSPEWVGELGKNDLLIKARDETGRTLHGLWDSVESFRTYNTFLRGHASKANGTFSETDL